LAKPGVLASIDVSMMTYTLSWLAARCGRIALIVLLLAAPKLVVPPLHLLIPDARADSVTYAYDALGRVIQATDTTSGQAVFFGYELAGNITSQQVVPITTLAVSGFSMDRAATGTQVTIDGTGFPTIAGVALQVSRSRLPRKIVDPDCPYGTRSDPLSAVIRLVGFG
jgi:hypothetical protein